MRIVKLLWPVLVTVFVVWALFDRAPALASEPNAVAVPTLDATLPVSSPVETHLPKLVEEEALDALVYWTGKRVDILRPWANAIGGVAEDRYEAIKFAAQAVAEGGFAKPVLDFSCNAQLDAKYRRPYARFIGSSLYQIGSCDRGEAVGPWQMHDLKMIGAPPGVQATRAAQWIRALPHQWSTWREANKLTAAWFRAHP